MDEPLTSAVDRKLNSRLWAFLSQATGPRKNGQRQPGMWAISLFRLWQANNFTRGPILLVEASSRSTMWRVGLRPGMAWREGAEQPFTVGSPVSRLLEALIELIWRATLIDLII